MLKFPNIPQYNDTKRLDALQRHDVTVRKGTYFTVLTQHVSQPDVRRFADYLIRVEEFKQFYDYQGDVMAFSVYEAVDNNRLSVWLGEGRKTTAEEDAVQLVLEKQWRNLMNQTSGHIEKESLKSIKALR